MREATPEVYLWHGISIPYSLAWHSRRSAADNKNTHNSRGKPGKGGRKLVEIGHHCWAGAGARGKASAILWQHLKPAMSICCGALAK